MSADLDARLSDEQLQALASLDAETIQRIGDVADKVDGRSRREVLAMLGAVGVAGGGIAYGTREATAQPDGSPGVIGTSSDRQDLWIDQADANEINTVHTPDDGTDIFPLLGDNTTVKLRPGANYTLSQQIDETVASNGLIIEGDGGPSPFTNSPNLTYTGPTGAGTAPINFTDGATPLDGVRFSNFKLQANGAEKGMVLTDWRYYSLVKDVGVFDTTSHGIEVDHSYYSSGLIRPRVDGGDVGGKGIYVHQGSGNVNGLQIKDPQINGNSGTRTMTQGIDITGKVSVYGGWIEGTGQEAILTAGPKPKHIVDPYLESYGQNMTTSVGIEFTGRGNLFGGEFTGGDKQVHVSSSGFNDGGGIWGGEYQGTADYHIQIETSGWGVYNPLIFSTAAVTSIDNQYGLVVSDQAGGNVSAGMQFLNNDSGTHRIAFGTNGARLFLDAGELKVTDDAGNTTTIS